jgi:hypothetical protein
MIAVVFTEHLFTSYHTLLSFFRISLRRFDLRCAINSFFYYGSVFCAFLDLYSLSHTSNHHETFYIFHVRTFLIFRI